MEIDPELHTDSRAAGDDKKLQEQDIYLPLRNVGRIMKAALPDNVKISMEARVCIQRCASEFISFVTSEACEKTQAEKRKGVNGEDVLFAMNSLGFDHYAKGLRCYYSRYLERRKLISERISSGCIMPSEAGDEGALGQELACGEGSVQPKYVHSQHINDDSITTFTDRE